MAYQWLTDVDLCNGRKQLREHAPYQGFWETDAMTCEVLLGVMKKTDSVIILRQAGSNGDSWFCTMMLVFLFSNTQVAFQRLDKRSSSICLCLQRLDEEATSCFSKVNAKEVLTNLIRSQNHFPLAARRWVTSPIADIFDNSIFESS